MPSSGSSAAKLFCSIAGILLRRPGSAGLLAMLDLVSPWSLVAPARVRTLM